MSPAATSVAPTDVQGGRPRARAVARRARRAHDEGVIGRPHRVAYDCPDPFALARFSSALLGLPVTFTSADWVVVAESERASGFAFQRSPGHRPPTWPDPAGSQQVHLDVMVDDVDEADGLVVALGATRLAGGDHVYADPAGHPFCLVPRPGWAPPVRPVGEVADRGRGSGPVPDAPARS